MPRQSTIKEFNEQENEQEIANYLDRIKSNAGNIKNNNSIEIPNQKGNSKEFKKIKLIFGHYFCLKFPLKENCEIPFSKDYFNFVKLPRGANNVRYDFHHPKGFVRQTNRSLLVYPFLEKEWALPRHAFKLKALLSDKAIAIAKELVSQHPELQIHAPLPRPSTEEYAIKDAYADSLDYTFENEFGTIDKSPHVDESGFQGTGGEIDWKSPAFADAYIRLPIIFREMSKRFSDSMALYDANIKKHLKAIEGIDAGVNQLAKATKALLPKRSRFPTAFKKSATVRGVN